MGLEVIAIGGLALGAFSGLKQQQMAKKQAAAQREAQKKQDAIQRLQQDQERRKQLADATRRRAQLQQSAVNTGVAASSGAIGGVGSIQSQLGNNMSFLDQTGALASQASSALQRASKYGVSSSMWGGLSDIGGMMFQGAGGFSAFNSGSAGAGQAAKAPKFNYWAMSE